MKHRIKNFVSLIIAVSMLLSLIPFYGTALDDEFAGLETLEEIPFEFELEPGDLPWEQLESAVLAASDIPACISPALAEERGHVNRLYLQEPDDYTVMFQNRDGSKTIYVFSYPVKSTGMSMNTSAAIQVNGSAISFSSGNIITSRIGVDIKDYSIGYCEIQTFSGGMLTADGVNITEDARGWARGGSSANNLVYNMSGAAAAEYNMNIAATANATLVPGITITPNDPLPGGGITVMAISYSTLAGVMSFKNVSTNQYLTLTTSASPSLTTSSSIVNPYSRWIVYYDADWGYIFANQSDIVNTYIGKMSSQSNALSIGPKDAITYLWGISIVSSTNSTVTIADNNHAISSNGSLVTKNWSLSNAPSTCQWTIVNHHPAVFVSEINPTSSTRIEQSGVAFKFDYMFSGQVPTYYEMDLCSASNDQPFAKVYEDDEYWCTINTPGVYNVYYKDSVTGVKSANFTLIITGSISTINEDFIYTIQPFETSTKYVSMELPYTLNSKGKKEYNENSYNATSNLIHVSSMDLGSAQYEKWDYISRMFVFQYTNTGYIISARLTNKQYISTPSSSNSIYNNYTIHEIDSNRYKSIENVYNPSYKLTELKDQNNALNYYYNETNGQAECSINTQSRDLLSSRFSLYPVVKTVNGELKTYYMIICGYTGSDVKVLEYLPNDSSGITISSINLNLETNTNQLWSINQIGVDAPLIKQTTNYWCGYTSVLQLLYGKNIEVEGNTIHQKIKYIADLFGTQYLMANGWTIHVTLNTKFSTLDPSYSIYNNELNPTYESARNKIQASLAKGWVPFFITDSGGVPYRYSLSNDNSHFISIIGYDAASDCVIIANCHYMDSVYGIYAISYDEFYNNLDRLFYHISYTTE